MSFIPAELIKKKRFGGRHTSQEIKFLIEEYTLGRIPDYQMAAWCMAVCFQGMSSEETAELTKQMKLSGKCLNFSHLTYRVDKHSTGGVGDKTSLILGPVAAAAGVKIPMIAGRGLGHTGGTLDKLESLPGFNVFLDEASFTHFVSEYGFAIMGQTKDICPADRKLYALRDVTGTVSSLPLICGSIMSKKLAEDLTGLVLDVKFGTGAFMKTLEDAESLAKLLKETGERNSVKVIACITNMDQPMGRFIGNGLEVQECLDILSGKNMVVDGHDYYSDTRDLSLILAGYMIYLANLARSPEEGLDKANEILVKGKALTAFYQLCERQGCKDPVPQIKTSHKFAILSKLDGVITGIDCEKVGLASLELGAGRLTSADKIDPAAGIEVNVRLGHKVKRGDVLGYLYCNESQRLEEAGELFLSAFNIQKNQEKVFECPELIARVLN